MLRNIRVFRRGLNLHEYQSKQLMDAFEISTQEWRVGTSAQEVMKGAQELKTTEYVVKAQVHAGGRGKGVFSNGFKSGVHLCKSAEEAGRLAGLMIGQRLITKQTSAEGALVRKVMVAKSVNIVKETYFSILLDRKFGGAVMVGSPKGGMDIEAVAQETPDQIFTSPISVSEGISEKQTLEMAANLGFTGVKAVAAAQQMRNLYNMFVKSDCTQVEINPLAETDDGKVLCIDAKLNFDDNAAFRQQNIYSQRDASEEDPREVEAEKHGLNYIGLDGNIACLVNGAGLAMATMDIISLYGGSPANFLDVGGSANEKQVTEAFKILSSDPRVKAILVNIFGGIMKCDVIARGVVAAAKTTKLSLPLVVRLAGTNVEQGKQILAESGLAIVAASDLDDAGKKACAAIAK